MNSPLPRYDLPVAEVISWLAWGHSFSANDFTAADGLEHYRDMVRDCRLRLKQSEEILTNNQNPESAAQLDHSRQTPDDAALARLVYGYGSTDGGSLIENSPELIATRLHLEREMLETYESSLQFAEQIVGTMAKVAGQPYGSAEAMKQLSKATLELWDAIKAGTVTALGKPCPVPPVHSALRNLVDASSTEDIDWQEIPRRWFWTDPPPTTDLNLGFISRIETSTKLGPPRWNDVRFQRPEIEALRPEPTTEPEPKILKATNRGRKPTYDSDAFWREVVRIADLDFLPPVQADLERMMLEWCLNTWGKEPGVTWVREKINKLDAYKKG